MSEFSKFCLLEGQMSNNSTAVCVRLEVVTPAVESRGHQHLTVRSIVHGQFPVRSVSTMDRKSEAPHTVSEEVRGQLQDGAKGWHVKRSTGHPIV